MLIFDGRTKFKRSDGSKSYRARFTLDGKRHLSRRSFSKAQAAMDYGLAVTKRYRELEKAGLNGQNSQDG